MDRDIRRTAEYDEDHLSVMTSSYHEISEGEGDRSGTESEAELGTLPGEAKRLYNRARNWVGDLSLEGVVSQEGQQVTYVTQDISNKIKVSSPTKELDSCGSSQVESLTTYGLPDSASDLNLIINEMEHEAKKLASSVDTLTENLTGILHSLSSMTVDCVFTASDGVSQLCDTADASIKVMYQVMAKCEELNKAVQPLYQVQQQIKETKRLLDKVESEMN